MCIIKNIFLFITFFLLLLFLNPAIAQNGPASFQHLSFENGLSNNNVNCIVQDGQGFIWIGTEDGLHKFNGYNAKIFYHVNGDSTSISSDAIHCSFKDRKNRLWFGGNGLSLMKPGENKFINFKHNKLNPRSIGNDDVSAITEDENGIIWVGTRIGLYMYDESTNSFLRFFHDSTGTVKEIYHKNRIVDMVPDMKGSLWIGTINGLYKFSLNTHTFNSYYSDPKNKGSLPGNKILSLSMASNGNLWMVVADSALCVYDFAQNRFTTINMPNPLERIYCDSKGKIWITTTLNGVTVFDPPTNEWKTFLHDEFNGLSLADNKTNSIFEDQSGMIWIGLSRKGVDRLSPIGDKFLNYKPQPGKANSLCAGDIIVAVEDKKSKTGTNEKLNNLWIASKNGLIYFDRTSNSFNCFRHSANDANSISSDAIYSISLDTANNLWVATDNGLNYLNTKTYQWKHYRNDTANVNSIPNNVVFDVAVASNGNIWLGTGSGFAKFNPTNNKFDNEYNNTTIQKFVREYYTVVFEDSHHSFWLSTSRSGIINIDDSFHIIHSYKRSGSGGFTASAVHQFAEDEGGNIWMATDDGLFKWERHSATFAKLTYKEDSLNGYIKSVAIENSHTIWISTSTGLTQLLIDKDNKVSSSRNFNSADGLQSNAFNVCAATKLSSGEMFFGGINGFNIFFPGKIVFNKFIPPVQLFSFKIFDKEFDIKRQKESYPEIVLNYDQNFFSFEMAALSFNHPEKNQFAYQLEEFDKKMNYCGTNHNGSYTNVPPGKYTLHIIASNNDGVWTDVGEKITITIIPPIWQRNWFRAIIIAGIVLLGYLLFYFRVRKIRREEKERSLVNKQVAEARLAGLSAQMNPHFIFNSLNSIQQFISEAEKDNALKYLSKFSKLIRLVLQNAHKNSNTITDELQMLEFYLQLEALRFSDKFTWHFKIDASINRDETEIPSMLLQPFVENAVIHGLLNNPVHGQLEVSISKIGNTLLCAIEDNGIGREAAGKIKENKILYHESLGMKLTSERMQMMEKIENKKIAIHIHDLKDANGIPKGTRVEIEINTLN